MASTEIITNGESIISNQDNLKDLSTFVLKRVIKCNKKFKSVCLEGSFTGREGKALLLLDRRHITYDTVKKMILNNYTLNKIQDSDTYECFPDDEFSSVKMMLIFPASDKHITKYEPFPFHLIHETPELYRDVTLPSITKTAFNIQWVYNILDHNAEQDTIVYEDENPETGFMLFPDLKWNQKSTDNLYVLALVRQRGIKSLRDITEANLPLLKNIRDKGIEVIKEKYGLEKSQLRIYIHYQPSYYHMHVHFCNIEYRAPGTGAMKSHLLETVINNVEMIPDYYQRATLSFTVKETDNLFLSYKEKGLVKELPPQANEEQDIEEKKEAL